MKPAQGTMRRSLWRWAVALVLAGLVVHAVPASEIAAAMAGAKWGWLGAGLVLSLVVQAAQAVRLGVLVRGAGLAPGFRELLKIQFISLSYGLVLPGGNVVALAVRAHRIGGPGGQWWATGKVLLADRIVAVLTLALTGLAGLGGIGPASRPVPALLLAGTALAAAAALAVLVVDAPRWRKWWCAGAVSAPLRLRTVLVSLGISLGVHALGIAMFGCVSRALGLPLGLCEIAVGRAVMLIAALPPVSVAGLGAREVAAVAVFSAMGPAPGAAVALSLWGFVLSWLAPGGVGALWMLAESLRGEPAGKR